MYKVVYDGIVIDLLETIRYAKYLTKSKRICLTDSSSANCIIGSNNKDRYHIRGVPYPEGCGFKTVSVIKIDEEEYKELQNQLKNSSETIITNGIRILKQNKIKEMSAICQSKIIEGTRILLSDNNLHHFKFSIEDQLNLLEIKSRIRDGEKTFIYHETNGVCKEYSDIDMLKIIDKLNKHKQEHLEYFNQLKQQINNLTTIADISDIDYELL